MCIEAGEKEKKTAKQSELEGEECSEEWILNNPVIDYIRYLILENAKGRHRITVEGRVYDEAESLERDFIEGKISEQGLKEACIERLPRGRKRPKGRERLRETKPLKASPFTASLFEFIYVYLILELLFGEIF